MKTIISVRERKFIEKLLQYLGESAYYDEIGKDIIDVSEDTLYDWLINDSDFSFLGKDFVKKTIHQFYTAYANDYQYIIDVCEILNIEI